MIIWRPWSWPRIWLYEDTCTVDVIVTVALSFKTRVYRAALGSEWTSGFNMMMVIMVKIMLMVMMTTKKPYHRDFEVSWFVKKYLTPHASQMAQTLARTYKRPCCPEIVTFDKHINTVIGKILFEEGEGKNQKEVFTSQSPLAWYTYTLLRTCIFHIGNLFIFDLKTLQLTFILKEYPTCRHPRSDFIWLGVW